MWGLILKDVLNLKRQGVYLGIFMGIYLLLSILMGNAEFMAGMIIILCAILPITAMSYDERAKWDRYALSMPVSRRDVVVGKYLLSILLIVPGLGLALICSLFSDNLSLRESLLVVGCCGGVGILMISILLPVIFKLGVEKARIAMLIAVMVPALTVVGGSKFLVEKGVTITRLALPPAPVLAGLAVAALVLLVFLSFFLSLRIYGRKEF